MSTLILTIYGHGIAAINSIDFEDDIAAKDAGYQWKESLGKAADTATWVVVTR